jgi:hypothetical protein
LASPVVYAYESTVVDGPRSVGYRVQPSASFVQPVTAWIEQQFAGVDGSPYTLFQTSNTFNDIYGFHAPGSSWAAFASVGCNGTFQDCELVLNTGLVFRQHTWADQSGEDIQEVVTHELLHWAGLTHDELASNSAQFSYSEVGHHWPTVTSGYIAETSILQRWLSQDDAQGLQSSHRVNGVGVAANHSFDTPAWAWSWFHVASQTYNHLVYCNSAAAEPPCYKEFNGTGWVSTAQDFFNFGPAADQTFSYCTTLRTFSWSPVSITAAVWDLDSLQHTASGHVVGPGDFSWRTVCSPTRSGTAGRHIRIETYVNTPNVNVDLDNVVVQ